MASISVPEAFVAISAATNKGVLTVADNSTIYPGALAWVAKDDGSASARVKILSLISTTQCVVRRFANDNENSPPSYGVSDMSAFAAASHLCMEGQAVPVEFAFAKRQAP